VRMMIEINDRGRLTSFYATFYLPAAEARGIDRTTLHAACLAGVEDAAATFDPAGGRSFASWAASPIRRQIGACLAGRGRNCRSPAGGLSR
jgi:hypothetical protein